MWKYIALLMVLIVLTLSVPAPAQTLTKHVTLYGDALNTSTDPGWANLDQYNYIICSPHIVDRIYAKRPELVSRCFVYMSFFSSPREHAIPGDIQLSPGDVFPDSTIITKERGGLSYLYYITDDWMYLFLNNALDYIQGFAYYKDYEIGGFFLDEWTISHTWYGLDQETLIKVQGTALERRQKMEFIEKVLSKFVKVWGCEDFVIANGEHIILDNPNIVLYHESVGSSWNPFNLVISTTKPGDFWQVNSSDSATRYMAISYAVKHGISVGMQPDEGVLSYKVVEDPNTWPGVGLLKATEDASWGQVKTLY